jgi:hypothetical protein
MQKTELRFNRIEQPVELIKTKNPGNDQDLLISLGGESFSLKHFLFGWFFSLFLQVN